MSFAWGGTKCGCESSGGAILGGTTIMELATKDIEGKLVESIPIDLNKVTDFVRSFASIFGPVTDNESLESMIEKIRAQVSNGDPIVKTGSQERLLGLTVEKFNAAFGTNFSKPRNTPADVKRYVKILAEIVANFNTIIKLDMNVIDGTDSNPSASYLKNITRVQFEVKQGLKQLKEMKDLYLLQKSSNGKNIDAINGVITFVEQILANIDAMLVGATGPLTMLMQSNGDAARQYTADVNEQLNSAYSELGIQISQAAQIVFLKNVMAESADGIAAILKQAKLTNTGSREEENQPQIKVVVAALRDMQAKVVTELGTAGTDGEVINSEAVSKVFDTIIEALDNAAHANTTRDAVLQIMDRLDANSSVIKIDGGAYSGGASTSSKYQLQRNNVVSAIKQVFVKFCMDYSKNMLAVFEGFTSTADTLVEKDIEIVTEFQELCSYITTIGSEIKIDDLWSMLNFTRLESTNQRVKRIKDNLQILRKYMDKISAMEIYSPLRAKMQDLNQRIIDIEGLFDASNKKIESVGSINAAEMDNVRSATIDDSRIINVLNKIHFMSANFDVKIKFIDRTSKFKRSLLLSSKMMKRNQEEYDTNTTKFVSHNVNKFIKVVEEYKSGSDAERKQVDEMKPKLIDQMKTLAYTVQGVDALIYNAIENISSNPHIISDVYYILSNLSLKYKLDSPVVNYDEPTIDYVYAVAFLKKFNTDRKAVITVIDSTAGVEPKLKAILAKLDDKSLPMPTSSLGKLVVKLCRSSVADSEKLVDILSNLINLASLVSASAEEKALYNAMMTGVNADNKETSYFKKFSNMKQMHFNTVVRLNKLPNTDLVAANAVRVSVGTEMDNLINICKDIETLNSGGTPEKDTVEDHIAPIDVIEELRDALAVHASKFRGGYDTKANEVIEAKEFMKSTFINFIRKVVGKLPYSEILGDILNDPYSTVSESESFIALFDLVSQISNISVFKDIRGGKISQNLIPLAKFKKNVEKLENMRLEMRLNLGVSKYNDMIKSLNTTFDKGGMKFFIDVRVTLRTVSSALFGFVMLSIDYIKDFTMPLSTDLTDYHSTKMVMESRMMHGGAEVEEINQDISELYIRITLLAEFYVKFLTQNKTGAVATETSKLILLFSNNDVYGSIISTVYERMYDVEKPYYDDASINRLIRDINKMYATFKNVNNTIDAFIDEVSSKIGLVSMNEIELYTKSATKSIRERSVDVTKKVEELTYLDMSTDYGNDKWEPTSSSYIKSKFDNGAADDSIFKLDADWILSSLKNVSTDYDKFMNSAGSPDDKSVTEIVKNVRSNLADAGDADEKFAIIKAAINNGLYTDGSYFYKKLFINEFIKTNLTVLYETLRFVGHLGKQIHQTSLKFDSTSTASPEDKELARENLFKLLNYAVSVPNKLVSLEIRPKSLVLDFSKMQKMVKECFEQTNIMLSILKQIPTYRKEEGISDAEAAMYDISFYAIDMFVNDTFISSISETEKEIARRDGHFSSSKMNSKLNTIFSVDKFDITRLVYKKADKFVSYPVSSEIKFIETDSVITRDYFYVPEGKNDDLGKGAGDDKSLVYFFNSILMRLFNTVRTNEDRYLKSFITNLADGMSDMLTSEYIADNADFDLIKFRDDYARAITRNGDTYGSGKSFYAKIFEDANASMVKNGSKYTIEGITQVKQAIDLYTKIPLPLTFRNFTKVEVATNAFVNAHIQKMQDYLDYDKLSTIKRSEFWFEKREEFVTMCNRTIHIVYSYIWKLSSLFGVSTDPAVLNTYLTGTSRTPHLDAERDDPFNFDKDSKKYANNTELLKDRPFIGVNIYKWLFDAITKLEANKKLLPKLRSEYRTAYDVYVNTPDGATDKIERYSEMLIARNVLSEADNFVKMYEIDDILNDVSIIKPIASIKDEDMRVKHYALEVLLKLMHDLLENRNQILTGFDNTIKKYIDYAPDGFGKFKVFTVAKDFSTTASDVYVIISGYETTISNMLRTYTNYNLFDASVDLSPAKDAADGARYLKNRRPLDNIIILCEIIKIVHMKMLDLSTDKIGLAKKRLYNAASERISFALSFIVDQRKNYREANGNKAEPYTVSEKIDKLRSEIERVLTSSLRFGSLVAADKKYDKYTKEFITFISDSIGLDISIAKAIYEDGKYNKSDIKIVSAMRGDLYSLGCLFLATSGLKEMYTLSTDNALNDGDGKKYLEIIDKGNDNSPVVSPLLLLMIKTFLDRRTDAPISTEYHLINDISELQSHHISNLNTKLPYFEKTFISIQHLCKNSILLINTLDQSTINMANKKKLEKMMELCSIVIEAIKDILNQIGQSTEYFETENKGIQKIQTMNNSTAIPFMPFSHLMYQYNDNFGEYDAAKIGSMEFKYLNGIKCIMANYGNVDLSSFAKMRGVGWLLSKFNNSGYATINEALYLANIQTDVNLMRHLSDVSSNLKMTYLKKSHRLALPEHMSISSIYNHTKMEQAEKRKKDLTGILDSLLTSRSAFNDEKNVAKDDFDAAAYNLSTKIKATNGFTTFPVSTDDDTNWDPLGTAIKDIGDLRRLVTYANLKLTIAQNSHKKTVLLASIAENLLQYHDSFFLTNGVDMIITKLRSAKSEIETTKTNALKALTAFIANDAAEATTGVDESKHGDYVASFEGILGVDGDKIKPAIAVTNKPDDATRESKFIKILRDAVIYTMNTGQQEAIDDTSEAKFINLIESSDNLKPVIEKTELEVSLLKSEDKRVQQSLSSTTVETIVNVSTSLDTSIDKNIQLLFSDTYAAKTSGKEALILQNIVDLNTNPIKLSALQREYPLLYIFTLAKYGLEIIKKHPTSRTNYYSYNSSNLVNFIKTHIRESFTKSSPIVYKGLEWIKPDPQAP